MKRSYQMTTLLLALALIQSACQSDSSSSRRAKVSKTVRGKLNIEEARRTSAGPATEAPSELQLERPALCSLEAPESCSAIRVTALESGEVENVNKKETANVDTALKLDQPDNNFVQIRADEEDGVVSFEIEHKFINKGKKASLLLIDPAGDAKELQKWLESLKIQNLTQIVYKPQLAIDMSAETSLFVAGADQNSVLQTQQNLASAVGAKNFQAKVIDQQKDSAYQVENWILQKIGDTLYLQYELPDPARSIEKDSTEILINEDKLDSKNDYDFVEIEGRTVLRILNRSIFKNVEDKLTIRYKKAEKTTESPPAEKATENE